MYCIQHLRAGHDTNGNPRRIWALIHVTGDSAEYVRVWDEGYSGMPPELREKQRRKIGQLPDLEITPKQYRELLRAHSATK